MTRAPLDRRGAPPLVRLSLGGRSREDVDADVARARGGDVTLVEALADGNLPDVVAGLRARGARVRIATGDELISGPLATRLVEIGIGGIEVVIDGLERLHDRCHGLGSWRRRLASMRAAQRGGLGTWAVVRVESTVIDGLDQLLEILSAIATQVVLVETGPLKPSEREAVLAHAARLDGVQLSGFALHGPRSDSASEPVTLERAHWHALVRGVRLPRLEVGTSVRATHELGSIATRAGGLRALGLGLAAMSATAHDLPLCMGGSGIAAPPTTHVASCLRCPIQSRCAGIPTEIADVATGELEPRRAWLPLPAGARVRVTTADTVVGAELVVPPLVARLEELGCRVTTGEGSHADVDLVITWNFEQAAAALDGDAPASARIVVGDFRMLMGREVIARRAALRWPDPRLEIVSAFPSFAHLYRNANIPLEHVVFRPFPIGPVKPLPVAGWVFSGNGTDHDRDLLHAVIDRLASDGPTVRAFEVEGTPARAGTKLELVGNATFPRLVDHVARARFVIMPLRWDRDLSSGGMPLALARAFGRPIVATRVPMALDHLREGVDSLLVDPGDVGAMAEAVRRLHHDPALLRRLENGARARAERASAAAWADELVRGATPRPHLGAGVWP